jgi:lysophospholipase L1-like esterase
MERVRTVEVLGDSILKGIQQEPESGRYIVKNDMDLEGLSRRWGLTIHNNSRFGLTAAKAAVLLDRLLERGLESDAVVMDLGGNDCDYPWKEIAARPDRDYPPAYSVEEFIDTYRGMVNALRKRDILPVLTSLPPLEPRRFLDWWCRGADEEAVIRWMGGSVCNVYAHQELYSHAVERLAAEEGVPLVDIRGAFLENGHLDRIIGPDGTHPNSLGQALISKAFDDFIRVRRG